MATKDSGKRGSKEQAPRRRTGQPAHDMPAREPAPTPSVGPTPKGAGSRRGTRTTAAPVAAEPQTPPARQRKPRPQAAGAGAAPQEEPAPPVTKGAAGPAGEGAAQQPEPVMAAPEAAATGSAEPMLPPAPSTVLAEAMPEEMREAALTAVPAPARLGRRERSRVSHSNALGMLIERHFSDPMSPCRSYSDLERRSGISREALSRYVTSRPDRRRSPTIDTLVAIADAMHLSLESVCRSAAASVKGMPLAPDAEQHAREEVLSALVAGLTDQQFSAVVELLRHLRPVVSASDH